MWNKKRKRNDGAGRRPHVENKKKKIGKEKRCVLSKCGSA
jgi:hypothetical protein